VCRLINNHQHKVAPKHDRIKQIIIRISEAQEEAL